MNWRNLASDEEFHKLKQFCKENAIEWKIESHKNYILFLFTYLPTMWRFGYRANNSWFDTITSRIRLQNSLISFLITKLGLYEEKEEEKMNKTWSTKSPYFDMMTAMYAIRYP